MLVAKRKDCNLYGIPGGLLEKFEEWEEAASRELQEETNLNVSPDKIHVIQVFNAMTKEKDYHNVAVVVALEKPETQQVKNNEPEKHGEWEWWSTEEFEKRKAELFWPNKQMIEEYHFTIEPKFLREKFKNAPKAKSCFFVDE